MTKVMITILAAGAFIYAVWLVVLRRPLPDVRKAQGLKKRFIFATLLFVGLFMQNSSMGSKSEPSVMCYMPVATENNGPEIERLQLADTLSAVWRTLDSKRSEEFRGKLGEAADKKVIGRKTADMIAIAFSELAFHKNWTRGRGSQATCYKMTELGDALWTSRENALLQVELLEKARRRGLIDKETAKKSMVVIAREVEMLYDANEVEKATDFSAHTKLADDYKNGRIAAGDSANVAAGMIVIMEGGKTADITAAKRLAVMKEQVEKIFADGPFRNDWMDPSIQPNVFQMLEKAGIIPSSPMVTCYERAAFPVKARSEELKKLQEELLDKNVKAGVLDAEVAQKAAAANESEVDYATEEDMRDYQENVRRITRLLYKQGELPCGFVQKIEKAADIEIISFDQGKALRSDMRWYFRSLPMGEEICKVLEDKKLIPPAVNHRLMMESHGGREFTELKTKEFAEFKRLIDSDDKIELAGDSNVTLTDWQIPRDDMEYRLKMRTVCRALIKSRCVIRGKFKDIEEVIGIPVVGVIGKR